MWHPASRYDMVRCGIALYGLAPAADGIDRHPCRAAAGHVPQGPGVVCEAVAAGERLSYGLRYRLEQDTVVATVPLGYADGVPRSLSAPGARS